MDMQLDFRTKILACLLPFIIAGAVVFCLTLPQYNDYNDKSNSLQSRKHEQEELKNKLADSAKVQKEKRDLDRAIASLRGAVPGSPDMEVLYIDLEKLCLDSGLELLSIGDSKDKKAAPPHAADTKSAVKHAIHPGGAAKGKAEDPASEVGVVSKTVELKLSGSYKNLMTLIDKLEHYQRVISVSEVHLGIPAISKGTSDLFGEADVAAGDPSGDPQLSHISLALTTYYLP